MKRVALGLALLSSIVFAQERGGQGQRQRPLDPCGSPTEVFSKQQLDKCYKGYFDAIIEARRLAEAANRKADDALKRADDALKRVNDLDGRVKKLESTVSDHDRRIKALEARIGDKTQLEEIGSVKFAFNRFNISQSEMAKIDDMSIKARGDIREVLVVGFADTVGGSRYNFNLSMYRAQMVASELARRGISIGRIRVAAYGKEVAELIGKDRKEQRVVRVFLVK
ncbi:MAG: OmpA family protein [Aquificaceae bacterium]